MIVIQYILKLKCQVLKPDLVSIDGGSFWCSYLNQTKVPPALVAICRPLGMSKGLNN